SGAIMALFAAMLVLSIHFPSGAIRTGLQMNALYVLIPSLLPLAGALQGHQVDYAAHFGGAVGGAAMGALLLSIWSRQEALPRFRPVAAVIGIIGVVSLAYPARAVLLDYQTTTFTALLIPPEQIPKSSAELKAHADELFAQYPRDPRLRFQRA